MGSATEKGQRVLEDLKAEVFAAEALEVEAAAAAEGALLQLGAEEAFGRRRGTPYELVAQAEASERALAKLGKAAKASTRELQAMALLASPAFQTFRNASAQYYPIMYFVDKDYTEAPVTCAGDLVDKPIVGRSYEECAMACDARQLGCAGFSYFPSKLCFLLSKFRSLTYYTGCQGPSAPRGAGGVACAAKFAKFGGEAVLAPDPTGRCANCLESAARADLSCPAFDFGGVDVEWPVRLVRASAFEKGTLMIEDPGTYELTEDVHFEPEEFQGTLFPDPNSQEHPQTGGFFLGFFAAVAIAADHVVFDCKGHSIQMTPRFHKEQRFFSIFELGSRPFISAVGPPQFANPLLSSGLIRFANNVTIQNCRLGLSSHHSIHGNDNDGVTLRNLQMFDFEVGGVHLNGASHVLIEDVDVGPSLPETFGAELSQALLLDHLMNTLLLSVPRYSVQTDDVKITLRGEEKTVRQVFGSLRAELREYLASGGGGLASVVGDGKSAPDGSAVYGVVVHKRGPAIMDFGACSLHEAQEEGHFRSNVTLRNVKIHDLKLRAEQWTRLVLDGQQVMGPAGDVFRFMRNKNAEDHYVGNALADAQLAVGAFKKALKARGVTEDEAAWYFGGVHIPDSVLEWAAKGDAPWDRSLGTFECFGDAMSHVNKGVAGLRLEVVNGALLEGVEISGLSNTGGDDADSAFCSQETASQGRQYQGKDVRGAIFTNCLNVDDSGLRVQDASLSSPNGGSIFASQTLTT
mmetsp:Transcript_100929/g.325812  ORF Transcript_100929/g.325812 Transcript_100929/m.325812 type:complete len:747 (-) Transcript_100929:67-2307(-)